MNRIATTLAIGTAALVALAAQASAAEYEVQMLNKGTDKQTMVFDPPFLHVQPGDTVRFVPTDKGHNAEAIPGMIPMGAEAFKGKASEEIAVTLTVPGIYGYRCTPHFGMGMVGLIEVGDGASGVAPAAAVKLPPMAEKRMKELLGKAAAGG
jgi:pseudoazurin